MEFSRSSRAGPSICSRYDQRKRKESGYCPWWDPQGNSNIEQPFALIKRATAAAAVGKVSWGAAGWMLHRFSMLNSTLATVRPSAVLVREFETFVLGIQEKYGPRPSFALVFCCLIISLSRSNHVGELRLLATAPRKQRGRLLATLLDPAYSMCETRGCFSTLGWTHKMIWHAWWMQMQFWWDVLPLGKSRGS